MQKDAIIVLSANLNEDGSLPLILKERVLKGIELFNKGFSDKIVFSGKKGFETSCILFESEAKAMKAFALMQGVREENILLEENARTTLENAFFVKTKLLEPNNWKNIAIVTSDYHLARTMLAFKKILGPNYSISFHEVNSNIPLKEFNLLSLKETQKLFKYKQKLSLIHEGDSNSVAELIHKTEFAISNLQKKLD